MQTIPAGYSPTLVAANAYLDRNPGIKEEYARASPGGYDPIVAAWGHYQSFAPTNPGLVWDFPQTGPAPPVLTGPIMSQPTDTGILNGKIFGVDTKLVLIAAAAAYFVFASKD